MENLGLLLMVVLVSAAACGGLLLLAGSRSRTAKMLALGMIIGVVVTTFVMSSWEGIAQ